MVDGHIGSDQGREGSPEEFPYRVLLAPPITRTIPVFAIDAGGARPQADVWSVTLTDDGKRLDRQAYGHLRKGRFGTYRFVTTRHRQGLRSALYAPWLAFSEEGNATAFLVDHPRYGLSNLLADAQRRKGIIEHDLRQGLAKGGFDLSELEAENRYQKAKLYLASIDDLHRRENIIAKLNILASDIEALRDGLSIS